MENYQIRRCLYSAHDLYDAFDPADESSYAKCYDARIYADVLKDGKRSRALAVTLPRTLHDHSISTALFSFLEDWAPADVVGVMGGHAMRRSDPSFRKVALVSKALTERGKLIRKDVKSISELPLGTYIIKDGSTTIKVQRK